MTSRIGILTIAVVVAWTGVAAGADIVGTSGPDVLVGTPAADTITGLDGNDKIDARASDDLLDGGLGADDLAGGAGHDGVVYSGHTGVTVMLDDLANDGMPAEGDNVQVDIEDVFGTPFGDRITGSAADNTLDGGDGDDTLDGGGGSDTIYGAGGGDRIVTRDGRRDRVDCGSGDDTSIADEHDALRRCEIVDRRPAVPRVEAAIDYAWASDGGAFWFSRMNVVDIDPARVKVVVSCRGNGCLFRSAARKARGRRVALVKLLRGSTLRPGARVEVRLTAARHIGKLFRFQIGSAGPTKSEWCLRGSRQRPSRSCS